MDNGLKGMMLLVGLALAACGSTEVPPKAVIGDSCEGAVQTYACSTDDTTVIFCNESTLWDVQELCDGGACTIATEGEGDTATFTGACCDRDGVLSCYPQTEG